MALGWIVNINIENANIGMQDLNISQSNSGSSVLLLL